MPDSFGARVSGAVTAPRPTFRVVLAQNAPARRGADARSGRLAPGTVTATTEVLSRLKLFVRVSHAHTLVQIDPSCPEDHLDYGIEVDLIGSSRL